MTPVLTAEQINEFLERNSRRSQQGRIFEVINVASGTATLRFTPNEMHLRPAALSADRPCLRSPMSGPIDALRPYRPVAMAVTANMNINF